MSSVSFTVVAHDLASRTFRAVGREAWAMALKVKAANQAMDSAFWHGHSQFKTWMRVIVLGLPLIPPLIVATSNALAGLNSLLISVLPGIGLLVATLIGNFKRLKKEADFAGLKASWQAFLDSTRGTALRLMTESFQLLADLLPRLVPIANAFGSVMVKWLRELQKQMEGPGFEKFLVWLRTVGAANFGNLLRGFENLVVGLANLAMAFTQSGRDVGAWFEGITRRFREWAANMRGPSSLGGFISYFKSTWPQLKALVSELVRALDHLLEAVSPLSAPFMRFLTAMLRAFNAIPTKLLSDLIVVFVALKFAAYGFAAAQWAVNVAMAANPVGIVLALLAGLVFAFIMAYRHSETFRRAVKDAFRQVAAAGRQMKQALKPIFDWFKSPEGAMSMRVTMRVVANGVRASAMVIAGALRGMAIIATLAFTFIAIQIKGTQRLMGVLRGAVVNNTMRIVGAIQGVRNTFTNLGSTIAGVVNRIVGYFSRLRGAWNAVLAAFRVVPSFGWIGSLASALSSAAGAAWTLGSAIRSIPSVGGFGILGAIPRFFATGGRPPVGRPSVVGEEGPELFIPDRPGRIIPADETAAMLAGGGGGSNPAELSRIVARELAKVLNGATIRLVDGDGVGRKAYLMTGGF